ncbi:Ig-like domain repeat protein [Cryobacterium frigoriphilum]|uniref:Ig-like domain repeat protein n=2 Tax=Cryobacterium frigoriphilum TaxID=1259150 RepID=A0A4R8ZXB2_9MICO|nr:Ig-like domain repeat protein [Cryobacterium frigoriphilum]
MTEPMATGPATTGPATTEPTTTEPTQPTMSPAAESFVAPSLVTGTGTSGSITVPVTPGVSGEVRLSFSGLAPGVQVANPADPASPITGSISGIDQQSFLVTLPASLVLSRFEIELSNPAADVDLLVFRADGVGGLVGTPVEAGPTASEAQEVFVLPSVNEFRVAVRSFGPATDFVLRTFGSTVTSSAGLQVIDPAVLPAEAGVPTSFTYSWSGLAPNAAYVAAIGYAFDAGVTQYTTVRIDTTEDVAPATPINLGAPVISGQAEVGRALRVGTGEWDTTDLEFSYQWQSDGVDIAGATRARHRVTDADLGTALSAVVTAQSAEGAVAQASAAPVVVKYTSATSVWLSRSTVPAGHEVTIGVKVKSAGPVSGTVEVRVGDARYDVTLNARGYGQLTLTDLARGGYRVGANYAGSDLVAGSTSGVERLRVTR